MASYTKYVSKQPSVVHSGYVSVPQILLCKAFCSSLNSIVCPKIPQWRDRAGHVTPPSPRPAKCALKSSLPRALEVMLASLTSCVITESRKITGNVKTGISVLFLLFRSELILVREPATQRPWIRIFMYQEGKAFPAVPRTRTSGASLPDGCPASGLPSSSCCSLVSPARPAPGDAQREEGRFLPWWEKLRLCFKKLAPHQSASHGRDTASHVWAPLRDAVSTKGMRWTWVTGSTLWPLNCYKVTITGHQQNQTPAFCKI